MNILQGDEGLKKFISIFFIIFLLSGMIYPVYATESNGIEIKYMKYDDLPGDFSEGLASVEKNNKIGFIDKTGKEVVPPKYEKVDTWVRFFNSDYVFHSGLALVKRNKMFGFINKTGKEVIKPIYSDAFSFHEGLAAVKIKGKWGFINTSGKVVIKPKYDYQEADDTFNFSEGRAIVSLDKSNGIFGWTEYGIIDKKGKEIVKPTYPELSNFQEGLAKYYPKDGYITYLDYSGKKKLNLKYDFGENFSEGLAVVSKHDKYGFINKKGKLVVGLKYDLAFSFSENRAVVEKNGKYGFIDKTGKEIVKPIYHYVYDFHDGMAVVEKDYSTKGFINSSGKVIVMTKKYGFFNEFNNDFVRILYYPPNSINYWTIGLMDKTGKVIVDPIYNGVGIPDQGIVSFREGKKVGLIKLP